MADNAGFLYESKINKDLKKHKLQSPSFVPAGADSNAPDAMLTLRGPKDYKVEVKLDMAVDFGQGSLDYDVETGKWSLGGADTDSAKQMREFLEAVKVPAIVNKAWGPKGAPRKFTVPLSKFKQKDVDYDYEHFTDTFVVIPSDAVSNYYNSKKTYYIQIGGGKHGLYYMGSDPAKIGCAKFSPTLRLRIRLKRGGSMPIYNYRFSTAIQAVTGTLAKSNMSLDDVDDLKAIWGRCVAGKAGKK